LAISSACISSQKNNFSAVQYLSKDKVEGVLFVFRTHIPEPFNIPMIHLRGLEPEAIYAVDGFDQAALRQGMDGSRADRGVEEPAKQGAENFPFATQIEIALIYILTLDGGCAKLFNESAFKVTLSNAFPVLFSGGVLSQSLKSSIRAWCNN
jgi:hypothetical protein